MTVTRFYETAPLKGATINGISIEDFQIIVPDKEEWKLPLYTITRFFSKYCAAELETGCPKCAREGHKIILGGTKADGSEYAQFETEVYFKDGDLHLGAACQAVVQKSIYTLIQMFAKSASLVLEDEKAYFNSTDASNWDDADPKDLLTAQDRIVRGCFKLETILQYDHANGDFFTYRNHDYTYSIAEGREKGIRYTNCVIVGNWVLIDAGFYNKGIYNHVYDGRFDYQFENGVGPFFEENFNVFDIRDKGMSIAEADKQGITKPGDIIGFESHNQTTLPFGYAFDAGRGLNTERPETGAKFLRWVGPNPYPSMHVGFIIRAKDAD